MIKLAERIAAALERIAVALERLASKPTRGLF